MAQLSVGDATYESTQEAIEYRRIGQVTAKGKRLPVRVWEAMLETRSGLLPPLISSTRLGGVPAVRAEIDAIARTAG